MYYKDHFMNQLTDYITKSKESTLEELNEFLAIKSISTKSEFASDVRDCARFIADKCKTIGMQNTVVYETKKHPIVYSEFHVDDSKPTVLIYGHYDVQPPEPLDLWESDPFKATIRGEYIYARGVSDDKGQVYCHIKAIEAYLAVHKTLPVNIKLIIEGEEEIGSPNLAEFLKKHQTMLKSDTAVISDTPMINRDLPALCFSLRGMVYAEITVTGPNKDLHSGQFGGVIQNPIQALASIIAKLKDDEDRVTIPGFYDDVLSLTSQEEIYLNAVPLSKDNYLDDIGVNEFATSDEDAIAKKLWAEPTLDCNGICGGYTQKGAKTIIPSQASAKISMRLVANQDPYKIQEQFKTYIKSITPRGVTVDINIHNLAHPAKLSLETPYIHAACEAYKTVFGVSPQFVGEGGTIPVVADFKQILGIDTVMMGFNCPDDCIHSPNERFLVANFFKGIHTSLEFLSRVGSI
jgi:acetylornithine deacetylase/succinyl-diaminopimelate desuccinylase-like protein